MALRRQNSKYYGNAEISDRASQPVKLETVEQKNVAEYAPPPNRTFQSDVAAPAPSGEGFSTGTPNLSQAGATDKIAGLVNSGVLSGDYLTLLKQNEVKRTALKTMPVTGAGGETNGIHQTGTIKSGLRAMVEGLAANFDPRYGMVRNWTDFAGRASGAIGRGIGGTINPDWDENREKDQKLQELDEADERIKKAALLESQLATQETNRKNVETDNALNAQKEASKLEDKEIERRRKSRNDFHRNNKYFDPATATEAQKRQLAEFGETPESVGKYDFTNPKEKTVAGISYLFNPLTKSWDESNLPKDGSKAIVEYAVTDPDTGVEYKYATTSEKAASLRNSLISAGLQIKAANERQTSQQNFQADQNDKNRQQRREQFLTSFNYKVQQDKAKGVLDKLKLQTQMKSDLDEGLIDQNDFDEMTKILNSN